MKTKRTSKFLVAMLLCLTFMLAMIPLTLTTVATAEEPGTSQLEVWAYESVRKSANKYYVPVSFSLSEKSYVSTPSSGNTPTVTNGEPSGTATSYAYFDGDHTLTLKSFKLSGAACITEDGDDRMLKHQEKSVNSTPVPCSYGLKWSGSKTLIIRFIGDCSIEGGLYTSDERFPAIIAEGNVKFEPIDANAELTLRADGKWYTRTFPATTLGKVIECRNGSTVDLSAVSAYSDRAATTEIPSQNVATSSYACLKILSHTHEWQYVAGTGEDANKIYAYCSGTGCDYVGEANKTLVTTLTAVDKDVQPIYNMMDAVTGANTYNGATFDQTFFTENGVTLPIIEYYENGVKCENTPCYGGTYTAKITIGTATAEKTFNINRIKLSVNGLPSESGYTCEYNDFISSYVILDNKVYDQASAASYVMTAKYTGVSADGKPMEHVGTYDILLKLSNSKVYCWSDGSIQDKTSKYTITKCNNYTLQATKPTQKNVGSDTIEINASTSYPIKDVEYCIKNTNVAPDTQDVWQDGLVFTNLTPETTYYIFARVKDCADHSAGPVSSALQTKTTHVHDWDFKQTATEQGLSVEATCKVNGCEYHDESHSIKYGLITGAYEYDGHPHFFDIDGAETCQAWFKTSTTAEYTFTQPEFTTPGEYTVYYKVDLDGAQGSKPAIESSATLTINKKTLTLDMFNSIDAVTYTGNELKPNVTIANSLVTANDFTVAYQNNVDVGTAKAIVTAKADSYFTGSVEIQFTINPMNINGATITLGDSLTYNGLEQTQTVTSVTVNGLNVPDFTVSNNKRSEATEHELTVTASGNFTGTATKTWSIAPLNIQGAIITLGDALTYNGKEQEQMVTSVTVNGLIVFEFDVSNNKGTNATNYTLTVTAYGDFTGTETKEFTIAQKSITVMPDLLSKTYGESDGKLTYKADGVCDCDTLTINVTRASGENAGMYDITASQEAGANPNYEIKFVGGTFTIKAKSIEGLTVAVELGDTLTENGEEQTQTIKKITVDDETVVDYEVTGNKATTPGIYTMKITMRNYKGEIEQKFVVLDKENNTENFTETKTEDDKTEIIVDDGKIVINIITDEKNSDTKLVSKGTDLMPILEADELAKVANGDNARIWVDVKDLNETIEKASKTQIEDKLKENGKLTIGSYIDISLFKKMDSEETATQIDKKLAKAIKVSIVVPKNLIKNARTYSIVRNHKSEVSILEAEYDKATNTLTFETDQFSDYGIAYEDHCAICHNRAPGLFNICWVAWLIIVVVVVVIAGATAVVIFFMKKKTMKI